MSRLNWLEQILVVAARRACGSKFHREAHDFLRAHGPEYADVRAWQARCAVPS